MTITTHEFHRRLADSGILTPQAAEQLGKSTSGQAAQTAAEASGRLVASGAITSYQAEALQSETPLPVRYGEYVITERIGQGGMGVVYKARRSGEFRIVALKVLPTELTRNADAVRRFRREVEAASSLAHPHIVAALDSGEENGAYFYVMEYVPGDDLSDLVAAHGALPVGSAVNCILHAGRGLQYAHEHGVTHRDVKPSNLLLDRQGNVRLLDLGLARVSRDTDAARNATTLTALTHTGTVLGTVDYMSPEQALNTRKADFRSDIYSLGCTLYFLLHARPPFRGETVMEVLVAHREQAIPSLCEGRDDVPERLRSIFDRCLAKKPEDRFQSMRDLVAELEDCKGEHGMTWVIQRIVSRRKLT
jgi:serine/threonine protein kinase